MIELLNMSTKYTVKVPDGAARWGSILRESISKYFNELSAEFKEATKETNSNIQNIDSKLDRLSAQILADVTEMKTVANNAIRPAAQEIYLRQEVQS